MPKKTQVKKRSPAWRVGLALAILLAAIYLLQKNWHVVESGLKAAAHADGTWFSWSLLLMAFTFMIAAAIYGALALHKLKYAQTVLIEISSAFVNRILPSGIGGLGLHGVYLFKKGHSAAEATTVISVNNLVGMLAHLFLLAVVITVRPSTFSDFYTHSHFAKSWQVAAFAVGIVAIILVIPKIRRAITRFGYNILSSIRKLQLWQVMTAFVLALMMTATYTLILFSSVQSIGVNLGILQCFVVFSIGMLLGTAAPTPGGLVGAEAGLYAGLVGYGVSAADAAAGVILFRLVSYWIPLIPGAISVLIARKQGLV